MGSFVDYNGQFTVLGENCGPVHVVRDETI